GSKLATRRITRPRSGRRCGLIPPHGSRNLSLTSWPRSSLPSPVSRLFIRFGHPWKVLGGHWGMAVSEEARRGLIDRGGADQELRDSNRGGRAHPVGNLPSPPGKGSCLPGPRLRTSGQLLS